MQSHDTPPSAQIRCAMILAAGRGERMRPLTDTTPKPLLQVHGKPLIVWHIEALARDGVTHLVVNTAWLEEQIVAVLGDGSAWGVHIRYSLEGRDHGGALETAGGIAKAMPWSMGGPGNDCFWLLSADIWCPGFRFDAELARRFAAGQDLAHLWLVPNPVFHAEGDFDLDGDGRVTRGEKPGSNPGTNPGASPRPDDSRRLTYANVALCRAGLTATIAPGSRAALGPLLFAAADAGRVGGSVIDGPWENVGTPQQLAALEGQIHHSD